MGQFEKVKEIVKSQRISELLALFYPELEEVEYLNFCEIQVAENPTRVHYGNRHVCLSETDLLEVYDCEKIEDLSTLRFVLYLKNDFLDVQIYYDYLKEIGAKKIHTSVKNISDHVLHLDYVSSYASMGFWKHDYKNVDVYLSSNGWYCEAQWAKIPAMDLGVFNGNNVKSMKNYTISNMGSWPTKSALPILILENHRTQDFMLFNIESNNCWNFELGEMFEGFSLNTSGANREDNGWSLLLNPNEEYTTVETIYASGKSLDEVLSRLTTYRRHDKMRTNEAAAKVYFNEYMWISANSPCEERSLTLAEEFSSYNIDYYIIDCGWSDEEEDPFYHLGKWEASVGKYPSGLRKVLDNIKAKGYKVGLWLEPEIVGALGDAKEIYSDDCYFQRYGKPVIISNRYQLDFRNEKVRNRLHQVVDKMVNEYGIDFLKIDYNIEAKTGTDYHCENSVAGMEEHCRFVDAWLSEIGEKYPNLIIETCASGGNRLDSLTLKHSDMVSISDQMYYRKMAHIVSNIFTAVLPEQAGVWCYPAAENGETITNESVVMNMVNCMFCVMYLSSYLSHLDEQKQNLVKEGIGYYRYLSTVKTHLYPYYPIGLSKWDDDFLAFGLKDEKKCFLAVYNFGGSKTRELNLRGLNIQSMKVGYPTQLPTKYSLNGNILTIEFTEGESARIFEFDLQ